MADDTQYFGQLGAGRLASDHDKVAFAQRQHMGLVRTMIPVKVVAVYGGGLGPPPTVDVQILVNQIDGVGNMTEHGTVYGLPAPRLQGGPYAIINDPKADDLGHIICADRDISSVVRSMAQANPGSHRRHSPSDSFYCGGVWGATGAPTSFLQFTDTGLILHDLNGNEIGFQNSEPHIYINPKDQTHKVYLGGDGVTGTYDFVETASGPSLNVKARIG